MTTQQIDTVSEIIEELKRQKNIQGLLKTYNHPPYPVGEIIHAFAQKKTLDLNTTIVSIHDTQNIHIVVDKDDYTLKYIASAYYTINALNYFNFIDKPERSILKEQSISSHLLKRVKEEVKNAIGDITEEDFHTYKLFIEDDDLIRCISDKLRNFTNLISKINLIGFLKENKGEDYEYIFNITQEKASLYKDKLKHDYLNTSIRMSYNDLKDLQKNTNKTCNLLSVVIKYGTIKNNLNRTRTPTTENRTRPLER